MVARHLHRIVWLLLLLLAGVARADISTSVDRQVLTETDVLVLELTYTEEPVLDLAPLEADFEILDRQQGFQLRFDANMEPERVHSLRLLLQPLRRGTLEIPAFDSETSSSAPISIQVQAATAETEAERARLAFMEAQLSEPEVFVQQTLYYDLRVYYQADGVLFGELPEPPRIADVVIRPVGDTRRGRTTVDGREYRYLARRFALVPQRSGTLRLPPETFTGAVRVDVDGHPRRRNLRLTVPRRQIQVHPRPDAWPDSQPWLPARNLTLQETLSDSARFAAVGEPISRTVHLRADDVPASLLPAMDWAPGNQSYLNHYPEQARLSEEAANGQLRAERAEAVTLLAERALVTRLPAISVYWWDLDSGQIKEALLPSRELQLTGSASAPLPEPETGTGEPQAPQEVGSPSRSLDLHPLWITLYLVIALFGGLVLWLLLRLLPAPDSRQLSARMPWNRQGRQLRRQLLRACRRHDPAEARRLLGAWLAEARRQPASTPVHRLLPADQYADLRPLLNALDHALYHPQAGAWNGNALARWVRNRGSRRATTGNASGVLPPLYPHG